MKKEFVINGSKFESRKSFFNHIEKILLPNGKTKLGYSLDVLDDILEGGFESHDVGEEIIINWKNFEKSKRKLKKEFLDDLIQIFERS